MSIAILLRAGVRIQMAGQAKTRWNECVHRFVDGRPEKKEVFYQADETFLDSKAYLRKGTDNDADAASGNRTRSFVIITHTHTQSV